MADRKLAKAVELTLQATLAVLKKQHPKRLVKVKAYDSTYLLAAILLHGFKWQCNVAVSKSKIMLGSRTFKHTRKADHPCPQPSSPTRFSAPIRSGRPREVLTG